MFCWNAQSKESIHLGRIPPEIRELRDRYEQSVREIIGEGIEKHIFQVSDAKLATFTLLGALNWIPLGVSGND